jgi:hypothetical protein
LQCFLTSAPDLPQPMQEGRLGSALAAKLIYFL